METLEPSWVQSVLLTAGGPRQNLLKWVLEQFSPAEAVEVRALPPTLQMQSKGPEGFFFFRRTHGFSMLWLSFCGLGGSDRVATLLLFDFSDLFTYFDVCYYYLYL